MGVGGVEQLKALAAEKEENIVRFHYTIFCNLWPNHNALIPTRAVLRAVLISVASKQHLKRYFVFQIAFYESFNFMQSPRKPDTVGTDTAA